MENKFDGYKHILDKFSDEGRLRVIPADRTTGERIDLSGNDYLGLDKTAREIQ